jgi:ATP-dependent helicase/nuclease subunit B
LAHDGPGAVGAHRLTLVQLASDLARPAMAELGLAPLTPLGLDAVAARIVYQARTANELAYFQPVASLPGFGRALARTLSELRLARVEAVALAETGAPGRDLAALLTRYQAELDDRLLADLARIFELGTQAAESASHRWLGLPLCILDVPAESAAPRDFLAAIAAKAPLIFAAVSSANAEIQEILGVPADDLDPPAATSIEHLRNYLFDPTPPPSAPDDRLQLFSAPGEGLESVEIARRILRSGLAFDQVAILLRNPVRYQPMIEDALRRAGIPAYFSRGTARPDPGGRAFLALLACAAEQCSASRFAEYLSLGQVPATGFQKAAEWVSADEELLAVNEESPENAPLEIEETQATYGPWAWEKLLVDAAVIGGSDRWERRLRGLENEFELRLKTLEREDQPRRESISRQLDQLRTLQKFALPLIGALDALPSSARWKDWIESLSQLARVALRRPDPILSILAEFEPMGEVGPAALEEVIDVLGDRLRFLRRDPPQRRYGRVFVGSIEEARGREFSTVFLPGLAEGLFPQRMFEDPLLLDAFRGSLDAGLPSRDTRVGQERDRLRLAVAAARDRLIASYPRMDVGEARPRVPSFYALELPRAFAGVLPELKEFERQTRDAAPARLNWPAPPESADAIDDTEYDLAMLAGALETSQGGRYLVETNPHLARSLRARWKRWAHKWTEADGLITADAPALAALAEHRLDARPWSASSLQHFAACPYRFALHGIYGLRPRDEAAPIEQMDPLTRGALFHAVQFALLGELKRQEMLPVNPSNLADAVQLADRVLDSVADRYREDLAPAIPRVWNTEIEDLRTDLRGWLHHVSQNDSDWEPIHFEFAFGLPTDSNRDSASSPDPVQLEGLRLRGSIDLVERHVATKQLRVTDHKTGKPPEMAPAFVGGGRFLQPLLYALAAEKLLSAPVESGRLFYATQQGGYQFIPILLTPRSRPFIAKLAANIEAAVVTGFLPAAPQKDSCGICDYRQVCGPYEELRSLRKDRRDERFELITEIRAMA